MPCFERGHRFVPCWVALAVLAGASCAGDPVFLAVEGAWHFAEMFDDDIHQVGCVGEGTMTLVQADNTGDDSTAPSPAASAFSGSAGIDNDCTSLDGPFEYFGSSTITDGWLTSEPQSAVGWDAMVNDASCRYDGEVTGDAVNGSEMSGTLTCTLQQADVTFNFVGEWVAYNWRSEWCETRRFLPGCAEPEA